MEALRASLTVGEKCSIAVRVGQSILSLITKQRFREKGTN